MRPVVRMAWGVALFCSCIVVYGGAVWADGPNWKLSSSITYEQGDFGTGTQTKTIYIPFTIKRYFSKGDVSLTVPYIHLEGSSLVTTVEGAPVRGKKESKKSGSSSPIPSVQNQPSQPPPTVSNGGIGDVLLKGSFYVLDEEKHPLNLSLVGKVKFPTASHSDNLGTGEFDEGFGVEVSKRFLRKWSIFSDFYYTIIGSPSDVSLKNQFAFDLGAGYDILPVLNVSAFFEERTALVSGTSDPRDLTFDAEYKITKAFRLFGSVLAGLSEGSPDYGLTGGASVRF